MKLLSPAISQLARMRLWRIEAWMQHPVASQREVLQDLVTSAQALRQSEINLALLDFQVAQARANAYLVNAECTY